MDAFDLGYALSKQVPAMRRDVTLGTDYGDLVLYGEDAVQVAALVERLLKAKLAKLEPLERDALD